MGLTIISPEQGLVPRPCGLALVWLRAQWSDEWTLVPELELVQCTLSVAGQDLSTAVFRYRYGVVKSPWEQVSPYQRGAATLDEVWVRVTLVAEEGETTAFVGRVTNDARLLFGAADSGGVQTFTAYGPLHILQRRFVSRSVWQVDGKRKVIAWHPGFNDRDGRNWLAGNRSDEEVPNGEDSPRKSYVFGGRESWTRRQAVEYLLAQLLDERQQGGPSWTLGGQAELLEGSEEIVAVAENATVAELLARLIAPSQGLDFTIVPSNEGFELRVFSLAGEAVGFGAAQLVANPDTVALDVTSSAHAFQTVVVRSRDQHYGTIRVIGNRHVICCTLRGPGVEGLAGPDSALEGKWSHALYDEYLAGTGVESDPAARHDEARLNPRLAAVFTQYGAPADWDFNAGQCLPYFDDTGALDPERQASAQRQARSTLDWLPLRDGNDYAQQGYVERYDDEDEREYRLPLAWVFDVAADRYVPAEQAGFDVLVPADQWGLMLRTDVAHRHAHGIFDDAAASEVQPAYAPGKLLMTIAFRADDRLRLEHALSETFRSSDGVLEIIDESCEAWYLAPQTVVAMTVDPGTGDQRLLSNPEGIVLRNDAPRLESLMCGAIARYQAERARAEIAVKGLRPWPAALGQVLAVIRSGTDEYPVRACITQVTWQVPDDGGDPLTVLRTGYAQ